MKGNSPKVPPKLVLFDYGGTLLYEPDIDNLRGCEAIMRHAVRNPHGVSAADIAKKALEQFRGVKAIRSLGFDLTEEQFVHALYDPLGITFNLTLPELEILFWDAVTPGAVVAGADKMLGFLNANGIRSAVLSNIMYSPATLRARFDRLLPENRFEFVMTSSEYGLCKPDVRLFTAAAERAHLSPDEIWYVGDNPVADVLGSASAGMHAFYYNCGERLDIFSPAERSVPDCPHTEIASWDEFVAILKNVGVGSENR